MKPIFFSAFLLFFSTLAHCQLPPCANPVDHTAFSQNYRLISATNDEQQKLLKAKRYTSSHCLMAVEVKEIASLFEDDFMRLQYCMLAYGNTYDRENFYIVFDAFAYFSTVFSLYDYIRQASGTRQEEMPHPEPPLPDFPPYSYPDCSRYDGVFNCLQPLSDQQYIALLFNILNQKTDASRTSVAIALAREHCFSVAQVMKTATLIKSEKARLGFLQGVYPYTFDLLHFDACEQTLQDEGMRQLFVQFLNRMHPGRSVDPLPPVPCALSPQEFSGMKHSISEQSFSNTKVTLAKQIISSKACFTSQQIKEIMQLLEFESAKLEIAKFAYAHTSDPENYYQVNDAFSFSNSIDELNEYLQQQK